MFSATVGITPAWTSSGWTSENRSFFENPALLGAIQHVKSRGSKLHLAGLIGPGGVHAHQDHLLALLEVTAVLSTRTAPPLLRLRGRYVDETGHPAGR